MTELEFRHGYACECEHWDSACDNMPQDYVDKIVAMTMPKVMPPPSELNILEQRLRERKRREDEERDRKFRENYRLVRIKHNPDGSTTECWASVKNVKEVKT